MLLKVILLHGYFQRFLNCTNGTKSHKASHMHWECEPFSEYRNLRVRTDSMVQNRRIWTKFILTIPTPCISQICIKGYFFLSGQKFSKQNFQKTTFVIISLNFWNNRWNSRKKFFKMSMIGLNTWKSKSRSKNWEKSSFVFFLYENQFLWFKTKITFTFPALYWYLKN